MAEKRLSSIAAPGPVPIKAGKPPLLLDTRVVFCGDNLEQLAKPPDHRVDLIYIDPPFNSNRNYDVFGAKPSKGVPSRIKSSQSGIGVRLSGTLDPEE